MNRKTCALFIVVILALMVPVSSFGEILNRVAAVVDDQVITLLEVRKQASPMIQAFGNSAQGKKLSDDEMAEKVKEIKFQVLNDLIEQKLLEAEVKRLGIPVEDREIEEYIDRIKAANRLSDEQLAAALAADGTTMHEFRDKIKLQILQEQYVQYRLKNKIEVTDEEARAYYVQHQEDFKAEPVVTLAEIRISVSPDAGAETLELKRQQATALYNELLEGADFTALAQRASDGPTASSGGGLGSWKLETELAPSYRKVAAVLPEGQVAPPYRDEKGYVILKCIEKNESGSLPFETVEGNIKGQLRREAAGREMKRLAKELRQKSFVDVKVKPEDL